MTSAKEDLGTILEGNHGIRDGSSLPLDALATQLTADIRRRRDQLAQQPETGSATSEDLEQQADGPVPSNGADVVEALSSAEHLSDRLPDHSAKHRDDAATLAGLDDVDGDIPVTEVRETLADVGLDADHSKNPSV